MPSMFTQLLNQYRNTITRPIHVLGIDLGTTNSVIAELVWDPNDDQEPVANCFTISQEMPDGTMYTHELVPSVVANKNNKCFVGEGAKQLRAQVNDYGLTEHKNIFYEVKNDIGVRLSYQLAPDSYKNAAEISAHILSFLYNEAQKQNNIDPDHIVITVPASFQVAQRRDTLKAAEIAGLSNFGIDLVDEPIAAMLDYLIANKEMFPNDISKPVNLLLFDYGGGTCDVALLRVSKKNDNSMEVAFLTVSRYHRLGGGDIDRAIFYNCLLPQFLEENSLTEHDLSYDDKKKKLEPAMLSLAENLKMKINNEINRKRRLGHEEDAIKSLIVSYPGINKYKVRERELTLSNPQLSAEEFIGIMQPFIDSDLITYEESEYCSTCSIFAPIIDALERCDLDAEDIDLCLLVGGSSLLVPVKDSMKKYFCSSKVIEFRSYEDIQLAVARGAAYQALAIALNGKGFIDLVCHEDISIKTDTGLQLLVPKGATLPYPGSRNFAINNSLSLPKTIQNNESLQLKLEVVGGNEQRLLYHNIWNISGPARKGDKLSLEYRYDENQLLHLTMSFSEKSDDLQIFEDKVEKPLTNVVNPNQTKQTILIMEEELRQNRPDVGEAIEQMRKIAELYAELGQYEKALDYLRRIATKQRNQPNAGILNKMGIYFGNLKDYERQEKFYRAAAKASSWKGPLFNLALQKYERKQHEEGLAIIEATLENDANGPYYVLSACLWKEIGDDEKSNQRLTEAFDHFNPLNTLDNWELHWYQKGARMLGNDEKIEAAQNESARRRINPTTNDEGILPSGFGERG